METSPAEIFDLTRFLIQTTGADGVIVLVLAGPNPYYSAQLSTKTPTITLQRAVDLLHEMAQEIAKGIEQRQAS